MDVKSSAGVRLPEARRGNEACVAAQKKKEVMVTNEREEKQAPDEGPVHGGEGDPLGEGVAEATDEDESDSKDGQPKSS